MKWCEEKTWARYHHSESSFIWPKSGFIGNPRRGLPYIKTAIVPFLGAEGCIASDEVIVEDIPALSKIKNSKILVIGGGPSANQNDWNAEDYDLIVSCNHFYRNEKIKNLDLFVVSIGDEVSLEDPIFVDYINSNSTLVCFENTGRDMNVLRAFKNKYADRVFWAHTRYHSKIGATVRMISLLCSFDPREIHVVGMDGFVPAKLLAENPHSFQNNKTPNGTLERSGTDDVVLEKYKQQYLEFWDYALHDVGMNIKFKNLGHGHPCNLTTAILTEKLGENYEEYLYNIELRKS